MQCGLPAQAAHFRLDEQHGAVKAHVAPPPVRLLRVLGAGGTFLLGLWRLWLVAALGQQRGEAELRRRRKG